MLAFCVCIVILRYLFHHNLRNYNQIYLRLELKVFVNVLSFDKTENAQFNLYALAKVFQNKMQCVAGQHLTVKLQDKFHLSHSEGLNEMRIFEVKLLISVCTSSKLRILFPFIHCCRDKIA